MPAELTSRERVLRAISHQDVDRTPCCYEGDEEVRANLCAAYGLKDDLGITRYFGADTIYVNAHRSPPDLTRVETIAEVEALDWEGAFAYDYEAYAERVAAARETGLAVFGGAWASIFTGPRREMGEAKFLMAMLDEPELTARVVELTTDRYLAMNETIFQRHAKDLDLYYFGSDYGTQKSLFISGESYRRFFKPHMTRLARHAKGFGLKVMFHTCGAVTEIIPDLIESGIDVLDPVQVSATGMAPTELAARFKGKIAFNGGISTQTTLPHGTPEEVRAEVRATLAALGPTGYICGPDQQMIGDTPVENIAAMYEAAHGDGR